jgi:gluconokinase
MSGPTVVVVMGVAGSGKTTVGRALAARLGWAFQEGDELHPAANVAKMKAGRPLDDADRAPWLEAIGRRIDAWLADGRSGVVSCSALKRAYRDRIRRGRPSVRLVLLEGPPDLMRRRLERRGDHFMPASLVDSQFADLEAPSAEEGAVIADAAAPLDGQVDAIAAALAGKDKGPPGFPSGPPSS